MLTNSEHHSNTFPLCSLEIKVNIVIILAFQHACYSCTYLFIYLTSIVLILYDTYWYFNCSATYNYMLGLTCILQFFFQNFIIDESSLQHDVCQHDVCQHDVCQHDVCQHDVCQHQMN